MYSCAVSSILVPTTENKKKSHTQFEYKICLHLQFRCTVFLMAFDHSLSFLTMFNLLFLTISWFFFYILFHSAFKTDTQGNLQESVFTNWPVLVSNGAPRFPFFWLAWDIPRSPAETEREMSDRLFRQEIQKGAKW